MKFEGGCYCGKVRYRSEGDPIAKGQCHCRPCQYIAGGSVNVFLMMPADAFSYTSGEPSSFQRADLEQSVTREFCSECGTHILTRSPKYPGGVIVKVGTMDDPSLYGGPQIAIHCVEKQAFHQVPDGVMAFDGLPR